MVLVTKQKRHTRGGAKQRGGKHHKHSDPYLKTYWPYLPLLLIVVGGLLLSNFWGHGSKNVLDYATDLSISELLQDTNDQRVANNLGSLALNAKLNQAAQAKANDMAARDYWSHDTPEGNPPWVFFTNAGYQYQTAGENLAYGFDSSSHTVAGWMASPGHRANILNTSYSEVGFGYANAANYQGTGPETIIVAEYASPQVLAAAPAASPTPPAASAAPRPTPPPAAAPATPAPTPVSTPVVAPTQQAQTPKMPSTDTNRTTSTEPATIHRVSRLQLLATTQATWSVFAVSALATICLFVFFVRHAVFWHRTLVKGENFIIHHKVLDIGLVLVTVAGFVLTRSAGVIH